ncbi:hypothetical protein STEG23_011751, partial [Scotinomys teguina]
QTAVRKHYYYAQFREVSTMIKKLKRMIQAFRVKLLIFPQANLQPGLVGEDSEASSSEETRSPEKMASSMKNKYAEDQQGGITEALAVLVEKI